jgi:hypothetical protein
LKKSLQIFKEKIIFKKKPSHNFSIKWVFMGLFNYPPTQKKTLGKWVVGANPGSEMSFEFLFL